MLEFPRAGWTEVRAWRRTARSRILDERRRDARADKKLRALAIGGLLEELAPEFRGRTLGFYWPMKGELDLVPFVRKLLPSLVGAALPVIVEKRQPLEFWQWSADTKLRNDGIWNIPFPAERVLAQPDVLIVPLLGFDAAGYRLGYGGGYYDRTLAVLRPRPRLIGVGYELGRLPSIDPQPHDIPMDVIVTEAGVARHAPR